MVNDKNKIKFEKKEVSFVESYKGKGGSKIKNVKPSHSRNVVTLEKASTV